MALKNPTVDRAASSDSAAVLVTWELADGDTANPVSFPEFVEKSVQVSGTFGGGTIDLVGSNDGTNYSALSDPQGAAITATTAAIKKVSENPLWIKPTLTAGVTVSITVTMLFVKA